MTKSSLSNSLNSSGGTFNSNSSLNSTPSVDRYAALKDLDQQLRESKTEVVAPTETAGNFLIMQSARLAEINIANFHSDSSESLQESIPVDAAATTTVVPELDHSRIAGAIRRFRVATAQQQRLLHWLLLQP